MNYTLLSKVYSMHKVKRRRIKWEKKVKAENEATYAKEKVKMIRQLNKAKRDGYRIIYIDETVFTRSTVPKVEYCLPKDNMTVDKSLINEPTVALLSGISKEKG